MRLPETRANGLLVAVPAALLLGALGFQHIGGLAPCEMCMWQRWAHVAGLLPALLALLLPGVRRPLLWLAILGVAASGAIGVLHAGVEQGWWQGPTTCSSTDIGPGDFTAAMLRAPLIRCDSIAWSWAGLSMAAWNAVISLLTVGAACLMLFRPSPRLRPA